MRSARTRIAILTLLLCTAPYLGLRAYLHWSMHDSAVAVSRPASWLLGILFALGVAVPTVGVIFTLREVLRDRLHLRLSGLLEAYGDLTPLTRTAKVLAAAEGIAGIGFVGVALGHYFSVCLRRDPARR